MATAIATTLQVALVVIAWIAVSVAFGAAVGFVAWVLMTGASSVNNALTDLFNSRRRRAHLVRQQQAETVRRAVQVKTLLDQEAFRAQQQLLTEARRHLSRNSK